MIRTAPGVVTLHDLQPITHPERFGPVKRTYIRHGRTPVAPRPRRQWCASPSSPRGDAVALAGVDANRVRLVPCGVDDPGAGPDPLVQDLVLERHGLLGRPFVLYPAITYAHKNHETLVAAFARLVADHPDARLVFTGGAGSYEPVVRAAVQAYGLDRPGRAHRSHPRGTSSTSSTGGRRSWPSPRGTRASGCPSSRRWCGAARSWPATWAASRAWPATPPCSSIRSMPRPGPTPIGDLLDDPERRTVLSRRGLERAHHFRWPDAAEALAAVYREAARRPNRPDQRGDRVNLVVLCPHFAPDVAPTGDVMTRIALELVERGHRLHVVTALPWYQRHALEPGWDGQLVRGEVTEWGRISRVHPFPTDKRNIPARALAFGGFTALATAVGGVSKMRPDAVLAMSPPLTLGPAGWVVATARRVPLVFNIQDVFPDVAVELGLLQGRAGHRRRQLAGAHLVPAVRCGHGALGRPGRQRADQDRRRPRRGAGRAGGRQGPGDPELRRHRSHPPRRSGELLPGRLRARPASRS